MSHEGEFVELVTDTNARRAYWSIDPLGGIIRNPKVSHEAAKARKASKAASRLNSSRHSVTHG